MSDAKTFALNFCVAGITSAAAKTICAPFERIKLILQNQDSSIQVLKGQVKRCNGIVDCFVRIPREQGFRSFWRGNGANIIRYIPTQALNFSFNDAIKEHLTRIMQPSSAHKWLLLNIISGGMAGALTGVIVYPLDFCQTRLSVDMGTGQTESTKREFKGLFHCISKIKSVDGIRGLYNGSVIGIIGVTFYKALYFGLFYGLKKVWFELTYKEDLGKPPIILRLIFAQMVTFTAGVCCYPFDTIGRRLMMESGRPPHLRLYRGTYNAFLVIYKTEGITAFYKGLWANALRSVGGGLVLVFYDEVLDYMIPDRKKL